MKRAEQLEKQMLKHARDLEFEAAAKLRDDIRHIRGLALGTGLAPEKGLEYRMPPLAEAGK
jgi:excinuclease UvrABC nuclease subunit